MEKFFLLDENFLQPKTPSWHCYRKSSYLFGKNFSLLKMPPALFAKNLYLLAPGV